MAFKPQGCDICCVAGGTMTSPRNTQRGIAVRSFAAMVRNTVKHAVRGVVYGILPPVC